MGGAAPGVGGAEVSAVVVPMGAVVEMEAGRTGKRGGGMPRFGRPSRMALGAAGAPGMPGFENGRRGGAGRGARGGDGGAVRTMIGPSGAWSGVGSGAAVVAG